MAERKTTLADLTKRAFSEMMKDVATSIPGHVLAFSPSTQLAQLQIGVSRVDKSGKRFDPPPLIECPVYVPGGNHAIEIQIDPGDEGMILFSQRCIDAWVNTGGIAENPILRFHDFSDAYFLPGIRSQPNVLPDFQNNGVRMRNRAGSKYIWLKNNGDIVLSGGNVNIISSTLTHNGINIGDDHTHSGVQSGGSNTGGPS